MKKIIKVYDEFADAGNLLSDYINSILALPPQGDEAKTAARIEVKNVCNSIIDKTKYIQATLLKNIENGGDFVYGEQKRKRTKQQRN